MCRQRCILQSHSSLQQCSKRRGWQTIGEELGQALVQAGQLGGEGVQNAGQQRAVRLGRADVGATRKHHLHQVQQQAHAGALHAHRQGAVMQVPAAQTVNFTPCVDAW